MDVLLRELRKSATRKRGRGCARRSQDGAKQAQTDLADS